jgi:ABC-type nickel/cobalt efflux system permease component RcnA
MILLALLVAFGLGMLHALSPGHGKTVMAAYLVGSRGTARHALVLGLTVTLSHTIGVFLLGLVTLYFSKFVVPEQLYPWLGFFSGMTIFLIGLVLLRQRWRTGWTVEEADDHHQEHLHRDWSHRHEHAHGHHHHHGDGSIKSLLGLGITGGMVPCPSALVVLLSAIAFHQITFGLLLILAFSAGIATTLVTIGLLMVYVEEALTQAERLRPVARLMPALSAGAVAVLGGVIAVTTWL